MNVPRTFTLVLVLPLLAALPGPVRSQNAVGGDCLCPGRSTYTHYTGNKTCAEVCGGSDRGDSSSAAGALPPAAFGGGLKGAAESGFVNGFIKGAMEGLSQPRTQQPAGPSPAELEQQRQAQEAADRAAQEQRDRESARREEDHRRFEQDKTDLLGEMKGLGGDDPAAGDGFKDYHEHEAAKKAVIDAAEEAAAEGRLSKEKLSWCKLHRPMFTGSEARWQERLADWQAGCLAEDAAVKPTPAPPPPGPVPSSHAPSGPGSSPSEAGTRACANCELVYNQAIKGCGLQLLCVNEGVKAYNHCHEDCP